MDFDKGSSFPWDYPRGTDLNYIMGSVGNLPHGKQRQFNYDIEKKMRGKEKKLTNPENQNPKWWNDVSEPTAMGMQSSAVLSFVIPSKNEKKVESSILVPDDEENEALNIPLIYLDRKSYPIWMVSVLLIFLLVMFCEVAQSEGIADFAFNPMLGPDQYTMIKMGGKYVPLILNGESWRLVSSIFLHSGFIHLVFVIYIVLISVHIEIDSGFWRVVSVFFLSGIFGNIISSIFLPTILSVGSTGALYGFLGLAVADLFSSWRMYNDKWERLKSLTIAIIITIIVGLTPFIDNFQHIGGFIFGFIFAIMLLPNLSFGTCEIYYRGMISFLAFPTLSVVFCFSLVSLFNRRKDIVQFCSWCYYLNCINISGWCPSPNTEVIQNVYVWN